jgi:hypothetical protein
MGIVRLMLGLWCFLAHHVYEVRMCVLRAACVSVMASARHVETLLNLQIAETEMKLFFLPC